MQHMVNKAWVCRGTDRVSAVLSTCQYTDTEKLVSLLTLGHSLSTG